MILRAFSYRDEPAALRWSAAGGLALVVCPHTSGRLAAWIPEGQYGTDRADVYGCDPAALRQFTRSVWLSRPYFRSHRRPGQYQPLVGFAMRRAVRRCQSGIVESAGWFSRQLATGLLWCGLSAKRPIRVLHSEVRTEWIGSTPLWKECRPGWAFYAALPGGSLEYEEAVLGHSLLIAASAGTQSLEASAVRACRLFLPDQAGHQVLVGLSCRRKDELYMLAGCGVESGAGLASRTAPWVMRSVHPATTSDEYQDHLRRWGITPTAEDYQRAGFP